VLLGSSVLNSVDEGSWPHSIPHLEKAQILP
jgi:hypothetical protein